MIFNLSRVTGTDIFFLAEESVKIIGDILATETFPKILGVANKLKNSAIDIGEGNLTNIVNPLIELTNITDAEWYLLVLSDRYTIIRTSGIESYFLPTNILKSSGKGSLVNIFNKIIELETI
jgi:hypothetical protein